MTPGRRSEILHASAAVVAGRFSCTPGDASWSAENFIGEWHHLAFASRPVVIRQAGHARVCVDRHRAVLYDGGQVYERELLHPDGDRADFVAVAPDVVHEALETHAVATAAAGSFGLPVVHVDDATFLAQRLLFRDLVTGRLNPLLIEERLLRLVDSVVAQCGPARRPPAALAHAVLAHASLTEAASAVLSNDLDARLGLADVGARLHVSPFHLARVFRAQTGSSLHAYRESERLRAAVDQGLGAPRSLSRIAADLGFSSHSHLTARFRHRFGTTPSQLALI
jgi:AraC-like DNA-binding protein